MSGKIADAAPRSQAVRRPHPWQSQISSDVARARSRHRPEPLWLLPGPEPEPVPARIPAGREAVEMIGATIMDAYLEARRAEAIS